MANNIPKGFAYLSQVIWERDLAISQLNDLGGQLGEKTELIKGRICEQIIDEFVRLVELKYLGVHPDELHNPHYAYEIVNTIKNIAKKLKGE